MPYQRFLSYDFCCWLRKSCLVCPAHEQLLNWWKAKNTLHINLVLITKPATEVLIRVWHKKGLLCRQLSVCEFFEACHQELEPIPVTANLKSSPMCLVLFGISSIPCTIEQRVIYQTPCLRMKDKRFDDRGNIFHVDYCHPFCRKLDQSQSQISDDNEASEPWTNEWLRRWSQTALGICWPRKLSFNSMIQLVVRCVLHRSSEIGLIRTKDGGRGNDIHCLFLLRLQSWLKLLSWSSEICLFLWYVHMTVFLV